MVEKIVFQNVLACTSCSVMSPTFISMERLVREFNDSKNNPKVMYLNIMFNTGKYIIDEDSEVEITAVVDGEEVVYDGGNDLTDYEEFLNSLFEEMGNTEERVPTYLSVTGNAQITLPTGSDEVWIYLGEYLDLVSENDLIEINWSTNSGVYEIVSIEAAYAIISKDSGDDFTTDVEDASVNILMRTLTTQPVVVADTVITITVEEDITAYIDSTFCDIAWTNVTPKTARYAIDNIVQGEEGEDSIITLGAKISGDIIAANIASSTVEFWEEVGSIDIHLMIGTSTLYTVVFLDQFRRRMLDVDWTVVSYEALPTDVSVNIVDEASFEVETLNGCNGADTTIELLVEATGYAPILSVDKTIALV